MWGILRGLGFDWEGVKVGKGFGEWKIMYIRYELEIIDNIYNKREKG